MPTYQYVCTECQAPHEAVQSFSDPALTECPACSGRLRKVFSSVGVTFKGSGFYRTDSRSSSSASSASSGSSGDGGSGGSSAGTPASSGAASTSSGSSGSSGGSSGGSSSAT